MMRIEQALYGNPGEGGYRWLARSPGFEDSWLADAQAICTGFGDRPAGVYCPRAVFALPLGKRHVAVVRAADQGHDGTGRPGAIAFRLLVLPRALYADLGGDPFRLDEAFEPDWDARELPALEWTLGPPPARTVADLERVLNVSDERCAWLLGGAQTLVDGGKLVLERPGPDERPIRDLWTLLPYGARAELWPATFAFDGERFNAAVVPPGRSAALADHVREDRVGDYPDGRYELQLQIAVESGDQEALDRLLARRTRREMLWVAIGLLIIVGLVALAAKLPPAGGGGQPAVPVKADVMPSLESVPPLDAAGEKEAAGRIAAYLRELGAAGEPTPANLDRALDAKAKPARAADVAKAGSTARQLRTLMWKHGAKDVEAPGLTLDEVFERLREAAGKEAR